MTGTIGGVMAQLLELLFRTIGISWKIGNDVQLKTTFFNDFESWEITGHGQTIYVRTTFSSDYERWNISGDADGTIRTVFSKDFEKWEFDFDLMTSEDDLKMAIIFTAIITTFHVVQ